MNLRNSVTQLLKDFLKLGLCVLVLKAKYLGSGITEATLMVYV